MVSRQLLYGILIPGLLLCMLVSATMLTPPRSTQAQPPPQPHIQEIYIPDNYTPPPGALTVAVQVTNLGGPATIGTITVSSPEDHPLGLSLGEPGVTLLNPYDECSPQFPAVRLYGPGLPCSKAFQYPPCSGLTDLGHTMAELVWQNWPSDVSHTIYVDVYPKPGTSALRLYVRAAMKGWWDPCDVQIEPGETVTPVRDQQGYPALVYEISFQKQRPSIPPPPPDRKDLDKDPQRRAVLATVQVTAEDSDRGVTLMGSGSLVDPRGYVLTNRHVVQDEEAGVSCITGVHCSIKVGLLDERDPYNRPPQWWYYASVANTDSEMDLAVLRLVATWEGDVLPDVGFPTLPLGNSQELTPGDELIIIGFPGIGGSTVTVTRGQVSGFVEGLIKTDANMSPGNSGGAALNAQYQLVGVPTWTLVSYKSVAKMGYVRPIHDAWRLLRETIPGW